MAIPDCLRGMPGTWREGPAVRKSFTDAAHRSRPPAETLAAYQPLMPRLGVTRLANVTGLDYIGIPVVIAVRPASRGLATAQGKGIDLDSAKASALMEAIETWHAERLEAVTRFDTFDQLRRESAAIDVSGLHCRAGKDPLGPRPICWMPAYDLIVDQPKWVPWEAVSCDFSSALVQHATFTQTTNGLASGNHVLEAILHGLCEVIERDAITLHYCLDRTQQAERRIDLDTVQDRRCVQVLRTLDKAGIVVTVWDCTSDIGVPVLAASLLDSSAAQRIRARGPFRGYGCHPSREIALLRALTEAVQGRLTYISGSRDDLFPERFRTLERMARRQLPDANHASRGVRPFTAVPSAERPTFNADLDDLLGRLRAAGVGEVAVVDLTRDDVGVPVVKVLVPGLENNVHRDRNYVLGPRGRRVRDGGP